MKKSWRYLSILVVAALVGLLAFTHRDEASQTVDGLARANGWYILAGFLFLFLWWAAYTVVHTSSRTAMGYDSLRSVKALFPVTVGAVGLNYIVKSGGFAGIALFVMQARRKGTSVTAAKGAYVLATAIIDAAFVVVLTAGLIVVAVTGQLSAIEAIGVGIFIVLLGLRVLLFFVAIRRQSLLRRIWTTPARLWDWVRRRPKREYNTTEVDELFDAAQRVRHRPQRLLLPTVAAVLIDVTAVGMLWCSIAAVTDVNDVAAALVAYAISSLFVIISIIPGGIGFAEFGLAASLTAYGFSVPHAAAISIVFRAIEFWIPLAVGALITGLMTHWHRSELEEPTEAAVS